MKKVNDIKIKVRKEFEVPSIFKDVVKKFVVKINLSLLNWDKNNVCLLVDVFCLDFFAYTSQQLLLLMTHFSS